MLLTLNLPGMLHQDCRSPPLVHQNNLHKTNQKFTLKLSGLKYRWKKYGQSSLNYYFVSIALGFIIWKKCCVFMNSVFWHFKSTLQSPVPFKYLLMLTRNGNMFSFHYFTVNTSAYILKKMNTQWSCWWQPLKKCAIKMAEILKISDNSKKRKRY